MMTMSREINVLVFFVLLSYQTVNGDVRRTRGQPDTFSNGECEATYCETKRARLMASCRCQCLDQFGTFDQRTRRCVSGLSDCNDIIVGNIPDQITCVVLGRGQVLPKTPLYRQDTKNLTRNLGRTHRCVAGLTTYLDGYSWRTLSVGVGFTVNLEYDNIYLEWSGASEDVNRIAGNLVKLPLECRPTNSQATSAVCLAVKVAGTFVPTSNGVQTAPSGPLNPDLEIGIIVGASLFVVICLVAMAVFTAKYCRNRQREKLKYEDKMRILPVLNNNSQETSLSASVLSSVPKASTPLTGKLYRKRTDSSPTEELQDTTNTTANARGTKRKIRFQGYSNHSFSSMSDSECDKVRHHPGILRPPDFRVKSALVSFEGERIEQPDEQAFIKRGIWGVQHSYLQDINRSFHGVQQMNELKNSPPRLDYYSDSELAAPRLTKTSRPQSPFKKLVNFAISAFGAESETDILDAKPEYIPSSRDLARPITVDEKALTPSLLSGVEYGMFTQNPTRNSSSILGNQSPSEPAPTNHVSPEQSPVVVHHRQSPEGAVPVDHQPSPQFNSPTVVPPSGDVYFGNSPRQKTQSQPPPNSSPEEPKWSRELFQHQRKPRRKSSHRNPPKSRPHNRSREKSPDTAKSRLKPNAQRKRSSTRPGSNRINNATSDYESFYPMSSDNNQNLSNSSDDIPITLIDEAIAAFPSDSEDESNVPVTNIDDCCYDEEIEINCAYEPVDLNRRTSRPVNRTSNIFRRDSEINRLNQL